ncbi:hypothetical protein GCM10028816_51560 [Spirosoma lituiforme]
MARKVRSDIKIGNLEKKLGLEKGAIRNPDGTDARSDKKLGTLRGEYERMYGGPPVRKASPPSSPKTGLPKKAVTTNKKAASTKTAKSPNTNKAKSNRKSGK